MPKAPIINRVSLFTRLRDKTIRFLDWNRVDTSLGTAWEPRQIASISRPLVQMDVYDNSITDINEVSEGALFQGLHGGIQIPSDFNTQ